MKTKKILLILVALASTIILNAQKTGKLKDTRDGQTYKWVKIGNQIWMAENLNYDAGPGSYVYANISSYAVTYGCLYAWETAKKACPFGWHLPSDAEWAKLVDYLGGKSITGGKLKEAGTTHWNKPNTGATNETGFTALPGGYRTDYGTFEYTGYYGSWWSSTEFTLTLAWYWYLM